MQPKPEDSDYDTFNRALVLATQAKLHPLDLHEVARLYSEAVGIKNTQLKEDVLFIIKNRLWRMPVEGV